VGQTRDVLLAGLEGNELELGIVGYQFPDDDTDPWDSNWLLVSVRVVSPAGTWEVVDPCLTTWEAKHLVRWLVNAAARDPGASPATFSEPNLAMTARAKPADANRVLLRAAFQLELRPPWARGSGGAELAVELDVGRAALARAAASLLGDLVRFPQRGDDPTL
jgi:hypothetical protein